MNQQQIERSVSMANQQIAVREETSPEQHQPSAQNATALAQHFIKSGYFKDITDVSKAVVKILAGQEMGIGPFAAMSGINVVQGRITLSANLIAAQIKRSRKYNFHVTEHTDLRCAIDFFEDEINTGESAFSMDDAKKAGLAGGDNWRNYPRNMLFARAISNGAKWYCPDVFGGSPVYTPDELDAPIDPQTGEMLQAPATAATTTPVFMCDGSCGKITAYDRHGKGDQVWYSHRKADGKYHNMPKAAAPTATPSPAEATEPAGGLATGGTITDEEWKKLYILAATRWGMTPSGVHLILGKSQAEWTGTAKEAQDMLLEAKKVKA